jgi:hypothetical protein
MTGIAEEVVWDLGAHDGSGCFSAHRWRISRDRKLPPAPRRHRERASESRSRSTLKGVLQARSRLRPLKAADRQRDDENCCARAALMFAEKIWTLLSTAAMELSGGSVVGSERTRSPKGEGTSFCTLALAAASQRSVPACVNTMWTADDPFPVVPFAGFALWCGTVGVAGHAVEAGLRDRTVVLQPEPDSVTAPAVLSG